jgi:mannose-1-phosphate guanylyltransferase
MAGGIGTRFWPMSRTAKPKQFIDILGTGETLIQQTFNRFNKIIPAERIFIVTNEIYKSLIVTQIPDLPTENILCEPSRRNTAPCIAYAAYKIHATDPEANIVVAPSDHIILKEDVFLNVINETLQASMQDDCLLTLGIKPSRPDTGYGYIQYNEHCESNFTENIFKVKTFTEKPAYEMAVSFLQSGDFLWNSGIFIWSVKSILNAFKIHLPEVGNLFAEGANLYNTDKEAEFIRSAYAVCKSISIDYGVMEKASNVYVYAADFGWSDLGTWGSLFEIRSKDNNNNSIIGKNVLSYNSNNCIVHMPKDKIVVLQGLDDYIVVEDDNTLLICRKSDEQQIRQFVNDVMILKGDQFV